MNMATLWTIKCTSISKTEFNHILVRALSNVIGLNESINCLFQLYSYYILLKIMVNTQKSSLLPLFEWKFITTDDPNKVESLYINNRLSYVKL